MRILLANKFLYPRGGAERAVLDLGEGLRQRGHEVFWFGMEHPDNTVPAASTAVVRARDYRSGGWRSGRDALSMLYSWDARRRFERFLDRVAPDIVHAHNIYHQITPAILDVARRRGIPVVMTLHDYKLVCPRYDMLRHGRVCDACVETGPTSCLRHRCGGSWGASLLLTCEAALHRSRGSYDAVGCFLTPSAFLRRVMARGGWPADRLRHVVNFVPPFLEAQPQDIAAEPHRFLFAGRLSAEKGLVTLLRAVESLSQGTLVICGSGPLEGVVRDAAARAPERVVWRGHLGPEALAGEIRRASFVVLPSEWFENAPFAVLEAMASGRAVVASRIGGVPELVGEDTGMLVPPGDTVAWTDALRTALGAPEVMRHLGERAGRVARDRFGFAQHLDTVLGHYREVLP